jgi:hypothetical protein
VPILTDSSVGRPSTPARHGLRLPRRPTPEAHLLPAPRPGRGAPATADRLATTDPGAGRVARGGVRTLGDRYHEAAALTHLGDTRDAASQPDAAHTAWQQALDILTDLDHPDADRVRAKLHDLHQPTPTHEE